MNKYLATYGKPRFLGIISLSDEEYASVGRNRLAVVCSHRGEELCEVVGRIDEEQERAYRSMKTISEHGEGPVRGGEPVVTDLDFVRLPSDEDLYRLQSQNDANMETLRAAQELIESHKLEIKLVDAEMLLDEKKLFFYFTSDQRVDFRTLVKDLARRFKTRIELRQMGVRDEARIIKGLSSCGLPCCCSYWLNQFSPIGIKMVKEQNIALNPAKISGICGRLMCCMSFEHKTYKELWTGMPSPGSKIKTPNGNYVVAAMDVAREAVRCYKPRGGDITVPIRLFAEFKQAVLNGEEWEVPEDALSDFDIRKRDAAAAAASGFTAEFDFSLFSSSAKAAPGKASPARESAGTAKGASEGEEEKTGRKRSGRKRGRRSGRKPEGAQGTEAVLQGEKKEKREPREPREPKEAREQPRVSKENRGPRKPRPQGSERPTSPPAKSAAPQGAAHPHPNGEEGDKPHRPRRRRRRPNRPKADGTAPQQGVEA